MLKLIVGTPEAPPLQLPVPTDPEVVRYKGKDGSLVAYGCTVNGQHLVHVNRIGTYYFGTGDHVRVIPQPSASQRLVEEAFRRNVLPVALQAMGTEVLHASAVRTPDGVIAFCAEAETGKSTTAFGMVRRGHQLWADDAVAFQVKRSRVQAIPLPFALQLLPDAASFFGKNVVHQVKTETAKTNPDEFVPLAAVFALTRSTARSAKVVTIRRLPVAHAIPAVMRNAYCFTLKDADRKRSMWVNYLQMIDRVPVFRLSFKPGLENLDAVLNSIESTLQKALKKEKPH